MITLGNARFAEAVAGLGTDIAPTSSTSVDLLLPDDLPVRVGLHPDGETVVVDGFAFDASGLSGAVRATAARLLLQLNGLALKGRPFAVGLTPSDIVTVTVKVSLDEGGDALAEAVSYASAQALGVRRLLAGLAPEAEAAFTTHRT